MDFDIIITVDTNDADYNTNVSKISGDDLEKIKPLIAAIKDFRPYTVTVDDWGWKHTGNYPSGEHFPNTRRGEKHPTEIYPQFDAATHEIFAELCPYGGDGFHSVVSVEVTPFVTKVKLL